MKIVLDSTVIVADWRLTRPSLEPLVYFLSKTNSRLVIPQIILEEAINKHREEVKGALHDIAKGHNKLRRLLGAGTTQAIQEMNAEEEAKKYEVALRARIRQLKAEIMGYDDVPQTAIVERALQRRRPFDNDGKRGYRDALLWETILRSVASNEEQTVFVSNNSRDFVQDDGLHPDLKEDLKNRGFEERAVLHVATIEEFCKQHLDTVSTTSTQTATLPSDGQLDIAEFIRSKWGFITERVLEQWYLVTPHLCATVPTFQQVTDVDLVSLDEPEVECVNTYPCWNSKQCVIADVYSQATLEATLLYPDWEFCDPIWTIISCDPVTGRPRLTTTCELRVTIQATSDDNRTQFQQIEVSIPEVLKIG